MSIPSIKKKIRTLKKANESNKTVFAYICTAKVK